MRGCHDSSSKCACKFCCCGSDSINQRLEKLEISNKTLCENQEEFSKCINNHSERIKKLESNQVGQQLDPNVWKFLSERVDKLESELSLVNVLKCDTSLQKSSFRCPVCNGNGRFLTLEEYVDFDGILKAGFPTHKECKSCEGKGIVWGYYYKSYNEK